MNNNLTIKLFCLLMAMVMHFNIHANCCISSYHEKDATKNRVNSNLEEAFFLKGTVTDDSGKIIKTAHIWKVGTFEGTISDIEGNYRLKVKHNDAIQISFKGKESMRFLVKDYMKNKDLNIVLYDHVEILDNINIVGNINADSIKREKINIDDFDPYEYDDYCFQIVEENSSFQGGNEKLKDYISKNINYPIKAQKTGKAGKVIVLFTVDTKGNIVNPIIYKGVSEELDNEAIRVVKSMPKWEPAKQRSRPVSEILSLPITFTLPNKFDK